MAQKNKSKPIKNGMSDKQLTSVNFPKELLDFLDQMAEDTTMSRSYLVCLIIKDFKDSGKQIKMIIDKGE